MKQTHLLLLSFLILALTALPGFSQQPIAGFPDRIIISDGKPGVAIFEASKISYAIGWDVYSLWSNKRALKKVSAEEFERETGRFPVVADLAAGRSIRAIQALGEPGCLVIPYRDGTIHRHYINDPRWIIAFGLKELETSSVADLHVLAPERGVDFRMEPEQPAPPTSDEWCVQVFGVTQFPQPGQVSLRRVTITASSQVEASLKGFEIYNSTFGASGFNVSSGRCR